MQEVFAIPVIDEIKNDNSDSNAEEDENSDENSVNEIQDNGFIEDEEIQNIEPEDLDKLFTAEKVS